ncbi:arginase family protein [Oryzifoliimicrobium ureilyticus]|uniref:arginase family protein n=1 Tax=Oryzifoliimicrobium ureilyticus TaxID=3113724 RepID=UPI0030763E5B
MQLLLLHFDDALELQPDFRHSCLMAGARELVDKENGGLVRLWAKQRALDEIYRALSPLCSTIAKKPLLCFLGSGDFHHLSAMLVALATERNGRPVTIVHIDNHPDWVRFAGGMHCGSWINRALENPLIEKVVTIGVCSNDLRSPERKGANLANIASGKLELYPYAHPPSRVRAQYGEGASFSQVGNQIHWRTISEMGEANFMDRLLDRINTEDVYITIDKDALCLSDAVTNWDQGSMRLPYVLSIISEIGARHRIIGADVIGDYSRPAYSGPVFTRAMKRAEIVIDQPAARRQGETVRNINSAANHALLEVLSEAMA